MLSGRGRFGRVGLLVGGLLFFRLGFERFARAFFGHLSQATGCINALDVGTAPRDWVLRAINYSPPSPLHRDIRNTTMEILYAQFIQSTRS